MRGMVASVIANPLLRRGVQSYFLSKPPLTTASNYLLALAAVLFVIWPKSQHLRIGSPPLTFSIQAIVATLIMAYLSLSYGAGKFAEDMHEESPGSLLGHGLTWRGAVVGLTLLTIGHTLFFVLLAFPLLVAAAHVSGISSASFGKALLLIVSCTLAYRWIGVLTLCLWETQDFVRYVVARAAF